MKKFSIISIIVLIAMLVASSVLGHPHHPDKLAVKEGAGACNLEVRHESDEPGPGWTTTKAHDIRLIGNWLMIYLCGSSHGEKAMYIPEDRVLWVKFK